MKALYLLTTLTSATARIPFQDVDAQQPMMTINNAGEPQSHRQLSGDAISYDDDFWAYNVDVDVTSQTVWTDYSFMPVKCMLL
jgi:hypothetical protein